MRKRCQICSSTTDLVKFHVFCEQDRIKSVSFIIIANLSCWRGSDTVKFLELVGSSMPLGSHFISQTYNHYKPIRIIARKVIDLKHFWELCSLNEQEGNSNGM